MDLDVPEFHLTEGDVVCNSEMKYRFAEDGFIIVRGLLQPDEVQGVLQVWEKSHIRSHQYGRDDRKGKEPKLILWWQPGHDVTGIVARCEKVVKTCEYLLGGEVYHYHSKMTVKEPLVGGSFVWHQDYGYWYKNGYLLPDMMTVFIAIDRCTKNNGCLRVLKGSHKCGRIEHGPVGSQTGADVDRMKKIATRCQETLVELSSGDALFFHCNLLHTSGDNVSSDWRRALLVAYNSASNPPTSPTEPPYTPLTKVPNNRIKTCRNFTDLSDKDFYHPK